MYSRLDFTYLCPFTQSNNKVTTMTSGNNTFHLCASVSQNYAKQAQNSVNT